MKPRLLHVSILFCFVAAVILTIWMLGQAGGDDGAAQRGARLAAEAAPHSRGGVREAFVEPDLPVEGGPMPLTDAGAEMENRVSNTVVRNLQFENARLFEVLEELKRQCEFNFLLRETEEVRLSLHVQEASLREVLTVIAEKTGGQFEIQSRAIVLLGTGMSPAMTTQTYRVSGGKWDGVSSSREVRELLEQTGINMPAGASAAFDPGSRRLIVRNTFGELRRVRRLMVIGGPDIPFEWHTRVIGGREYVSADEVWRFYWFGGAMPGEGTVSFVSEAMKMEWRRDDRVIEIGGVRYFLQMPVVESQGTLWISRADLAWTVEPVLRPVCGRNAAPLTTVVMDVSPNSNWGSAGDAAAADFRAALEIAEPLKARLEREGWTVVMTNADDARRSRGECRAVANGHPEAVLVSIRGRVGPGGSGFETYLTNPAARGDGTLRSRAVGLAAAVHGQCVRQWGGKDGGVRSTGGDILDGLVIPGMVLRTCGALSGGEGDANGDNGFKMASVIAEGLENYRRSAGRKPKAEVLSGAER